MPGQQLFILRVRKQLNLFHGGGAIQSAQLKQLRHDSIDQWRADRTFVHGKKFVRVSRKYPSANPGVVLHLQARPVAIIPGRRSMQPHLGLQLDFRDAPQRLAQNFSFEFNLPLIGNVLVVASAALPEIGTPSFDAIGRRFDQVVLPSRARSRASLAGSRPQFFLQATRTEQTPPCCARPSQPECVRCHLRHKSVFRWKAASD